jgi:hypothetical protein
VSPFLFFFSCYVSQSGTGDPPPQPSKCWHDKCAPPFTDLYLLFIKTLVIGFRQYDSLRSLTNDLCKHLYSGEGCSLRFWVHLDLGGYSGGPCMCIAYKQICSLSVV